MKPIEIRCRLKPSQFTGANGYRMTYKGVVSYFPSQIVSFFVMDPSEVDGCLVMSEIEDIWIRNQRESNETIKSLKSNNTMNAQVTLPLSEIDTLRKERQDAIDQVASLMEKQMMVKVVAFERIHHYSAGQRDRILSPLEEWNKYPHEYRNLEDVRIVIRQEESQKVQERISEAEKTNRDLHDKLRKKDEEIDRINEAWKKDLEEHKKFLQGKIDQSKEAERNEKLLKLEKELAAKDEMIKKIMGQGFWERIFNPIHIQL